MMNIQDEVTIFILRVIDFALDIISLGAWSRWQGSRLANFKVKER